ncbi:hypothetical protein RhiirA4_476945 [Rhizophagus irregularis]|uniref:Uncharacterized protein n=1 Tax=Rhizophagus irregularis TaxID=588596 RepID=A0A2I1HCF2_9GLOM|nr:hypothetical protein RhiirA4_476945 [Rhizophagus irregularis]
MLKKIKQPEVLQELYRLRPEFNGKPIFDGERSALATIFFELNTSGFNLSSILKTKPIPY